MMALTMEPEPKTHLRHRALRVAVPMEGQASLGVGGVAHDEGIVNGTCLFGKPRWRPQKHVKLLISLRLYRKALLRATQSTPQ